MVCFLIYLIVGGVTFLVIRKKYYPELIRRFDANESMASERDDVLANYKEFWLILLMPLVWFISIPTYLIYKLICNKFFKKQ